MPADIGGPAYCGAELLLGLDKVYIQEILSFSGGINKKEWNIKYNLYAPIFTNSKIIFFSFSLFGYIHFIYRLILFIIHNRRSHVVIHGIHNVPYLISTFLCNIFRAKSYIIPHGTLSENCIQVSSNFLVKNFTLLYAKVFLRYHNIVFSNKNEYSMSVLSKPSELKGFKINFIPNILSTRSLFEYIDFLPKKLVFRKQPVNLSNQIEHDVENKLNKYKKLELYPRIEIIYFGRISIEKGIEKLIEFIDSDYSTDNAKLVVHIIGGCEDKYFSYIKNKCKSINGHKFIFYGWLPRDSAHSLLKIIPGVMIFPSLSDNFNLSFLESILLGKKAIVSNRINTVYDDWLSSRIKILKIESFTTSLKNILNDQSLIKESMDDEKDQFNCLPIEVHPYSQKNIIKEWFEILK
tara:strand:+ start:2726 stop:3946 length:1221 start_codon:yes stop_codon:yes gene_type:complete